MAVFLSPRWTPISQGPSSPTIVARGTATAAKEDLARDESDEEEEVMGTATQPVPSPRVRASARILLRISEDTVPKKLEFDNSPVQGTQVDVPDKKGVPEVVSELPGQPTVTPQQVVRVKSHAKHEKWRKEHDEQLEEIVKQHLMTNVPLNEAFEEACVTIDRKHGHSVKSSMRPCPACEDRWHKVIKVRLEGDETMKNWWWTKSYGRSRQVARGTKRKFIEEDEDTSDSEYEELPLNLPESESEPKSESESESEEITPVPESEKNKAPALENGVPVSVDDISADMYNKISDLVKVWKRMHPLLHASYEHDRTCWNRIGAQEPPVVKATGKKVDSDAIPVDFKRSFLHLNSFEVAMHQITYMREAMDDHKKAANNFNEQMETFRKYCTRLPPGDIHRTSVYWELSVVHEKHSIEEWLELAEKHFHESMKRRFGMAYYINTKDTLSEGQLHEIEFYYTMDKALRATGVYEGTHHNKIAPCLPRTEYQSKCYEDRLGKLYKHNEDAIRSGNNRGQEQLCIGLELDTYMNEKYC